MSIAMALLLSLHAFWGSIIFKMVLKTMRDSTVTKEGDARSDSEDSDCEPSLSPIQSPKTSPKGSRAKAAEGKKLK